MHEVFVFVESRDVNWNVKCLLPLSSQGCRLFFDITIMLRKFSCAQGCLAISVIIKTNKLKINMRCRTHFRPTYDPPIFRPLARRPYQIIQRCQWKVSKCTHLSKGYSFTPTTHKTQQVRLL